MTDRILKVLVFTSTGNGGVTSHLDHVGMFARYSRHECYYHNFIYQFDPDMNLSGFDVIVLTHNLWMPALSSEQRAALAKAPALKVLFLQDEFQYLRVFNDVMDEIGVNIMFTCVSPKDFDAFYPKDRISSLREVHQNLTGYVSDELADPHLRRTGQRRWDVGYRGRAPIYYMGELGQHKTRVADEFARLCVDKGLSANISYLEEDRLSGRAWLTFLRSTRVQLGSPSGTSIVDLDGSLIEAEAAYRAAHPHASFNEVHSRIHAPHEGKMVIDTISPRHFEYAATGATMVMVRGDYGGHLTADEHYIPIEADYSNLDEVAEKIRDHRYCEDMADRAHAHLISSGDFHATRFVATFDEILSRNTVSKLQVAAPPRAEFDRQLKDAHDQALFFERNGVVIVDSDAGRQLKRDAFKRRCLTALPVLGGMFRREGGDPLLKLHKGLAALDVTFMNATFRKVAIEWLRDPEHRYRHRVHTADLLKSLLLLGVMKAARSGAAPFGSDLQTNLRLEPGAITLVGLPVDATPPGGTGPDAAGLMYHIATQSSCEVRLDLSARWPIRLFGHSTIMPWSIRGKSSLFRSNPDEYFPLRALTVIAQFAPKAVADVLADAMTPANAAERRHLSRAFGITLPVP